MYYVEYATTLSSLTGPRERGIGSSIRKRIDLTRTLKRCRNIHGRNLSSILVRKLAEKVDNHWSGAPTALSPPPLPPFWTAHGLTTTTTSHFT
jgi:hypothetical protein